MTSSEDSPATDQEEGNLSGDSTETVDESVDPQVTEFELVEIADQI